MWFADKFLFVKPDRQNLLRRKQMSEKTVFSRGSFFHGTRADLKMGDLIVTGKKKNWFKAGKVETG